MNRSVRTGLENLLASPPDEIQGKRLGLLCHPASVNRQFRHARQLINDRFPGQLTALYSPQHGFFGEKQDNMVESAHGTDPLLGLPVYSLYGETRIPTGEMLAPIDILIVDLQDAGTRVYTFIWTLSHCMEAAREFGKTVLVLDRPNPVGGLAVEGNCLKPEWASFVGRYPIPMRHGLTIGEMARLFNDHYEIGCDLQILPMTGWRRSMFFKDTGLPWVAPSPNLPTTDAAMVYPGQVIWEGTNVSEGRGTTQPFEIFGAPFTDPFRLLSDRVLNQPAGVIFRPAAFEPMFHKWCGQLCRGLQLHVVDPSAFRPYETTLRLLQAVIGNYPDDFQWKPPPYEYEYHRLPIDLILGDMAVRRYIESLDPVEDIVRSWGEELAAFRRLSENVFLYRS